MSDIIGVGSSGAQPSPEPPSPACQVLTFPPPPSRPGSYQRIKIKTVSARLLSATPAAGLWLFVMQAADAEA